jgi:hypothetical protein
MGYEVGLMAPYTAADSTSAGPTLARFRVTPRAGGV